MRAELALLCILYHSFHSNGIGFILVYHISYCCIVVYTRLGIFYINVTNMWNIEYWIWSYSNI